MKLKRASLVGENKYRWSILPVLAYLNYNDENRYVYRHTIIFGWITWHFAILWGEMD